jgi:uncharacterized membrane protein
MLPVLKLIKLWGIGFVAFTALDLIWIGFVASKLYHGQIGHLLNLVEGEMKVNVPAALATWVLIVGGIVFFVAPKVSNDNSLLVPFLWGALYGFILYGVYDLTNYAVLKGWPLAITLFDIAWGTFACAVTAVLISYVNRLFA